MALLDDTKLAMRVITTAYDDEFNRLISAGIKDMEGCGIAYTSSNELMNTAVIEYVGSKFKKDEEREKHEKSYRELVSQMRFLTGYVTT